MSTTYSDIIKKWPSDGALAKDLSEGSAADSVTRDVVKKWRQRASIPPEYWLPLEHAARRRGIENVTIFVLAEIAAAKRGDCRRQARGARVSAQQGPDWDLFSTGPLVQLAAAKRGAHA